MASGLVEQRSDRALLGWEWAPPPDPEPSPRRQLEPKPAQAPLRLPAPSSSGMDTRTKAYLLLGGGGVLALMAISSASILVFAVPLLAYGGWLLYGEEQRSEEQRSLEQANADRQRSFAEEHGRWKEAIVQDEAEERRRFEVAPRWYPIERFEPARRLDVFGGEAEGWASLLHTAFGAAVQTTPVTVLDLTRRNLAQRALWPGSGANGATRPIVMPAELARFDPLVGTRHPSEIAALLIGSETPNDDWARRDVEIGILRRMTDVLGEDVTLVRLLSAVTALLASESPLVATHLSAQERRVLLDPGFVVMLGGDSSAHLGRLAAALEAVVRGGGNIGGSRPARLPFLPAEGAAVIATGDTSGPESRRRLDNLLAAALIDRMSNAGPARGLVLVVGADRLSRPLLDGLTESAHDRGLGLAMFFENLSGPAREIIGRGASDTILMRLGHHEDALAGANFIGKEHRFVISSITLTVGTQLGGSDNHGFTVTYSDSHTDQTAGPDSRTSGRSVGTSFNYGSTWSDTENYGETSTRSEEFVTRAEDLQRIPTTGFIFVTAVNGRKHVIVGDCHPAIAQTPLVAPRAIARR